MDRSALIIYLRDIRDMEVTKQTLNMMYREKEKQLNAYINDANKPARAIDVIEEPKYKNTTMEGATLASSVSAGVSFGAVLLMIGTRGALGVLFTFLAIALVSLVVLIRHSIQNGAMKKVWKMQMNTAQVQYEHRVEEKRRQVQMIPRHQQEFARYGAWIAEEKRKVDRILTNLYGLNELPSQYRNLPSVQYIYEYMSTSRATFSETLMHEHMENGIQRLESRMGELAKQLSELVYQTRCLRRENREYAEMLQRQNEEALKHLERTAKNAEEAKEYAAVAAANSEVNAYYAKAQYNYNVWGI